MTAIASTSSVTSARWAAPVQLAAAAVLWIACLYFPEPVIAMSGLAALCFAAVLVAGPRARV
ncbi:hypothetical protein [Nocardia sp. NPDC052566]|uniref:hypothetical protein n=1 Tax=Nocardia sp. NPDC052566 TaxID=3364330 RepID=UPI0037C9A37D